MLSIADRCVLLFPALVMAGLILLSATPLNLFSLSLVPNVAWLMTLAFARLAPQSMPALLVFCAGLLQDVLFGTPLGAQAVIALLLLIVVRSCPSRVGVPLLRDVWSEAAVLLIAAQMVLVAIVFWVRHSALAPLPQLGAVIVNLVWFPLFAFAAARYLEFLPKLGK